MGWFAMVKVIAGFIQVDKPSTLPYKVAFSIGYGIRLPSVLGNHAFGQLQKFVSRAIISLGWLWFQISGLESGVR